MSNLNSSGCQHCRSELYLESEEGRQYRQEHGGLHDGNAFVASPEYGYDKRWVFRDCLTNKFHFVFNYCPMCGAKLWGE